MSRYDIDQFDPSPDPDLVCCICTSVLYDPVETPCRHVFCRSCISTWIARKKTCPTCRQRIAGEDDIKVVLPLVQNLINKLMMKCGNDVNGCLDKIALESYETHLSSCLYGKVPCGFSKCKDEVIRKELDAHRSTCVYQEIKCESSCGLLVLLSELRSHSCVQALIDKLHEQEECIAQAHVERQRLEESAAQLNRQLVILEEQLQRLRGQQDSEHNSDSTDPLLTSDDDNDSLGSGLSTPWASTGSTPSISTESSPSVSTDSVSTISSFNFSASPQLSPSISGSTHRDNSLRVPDDHVGSFSPDINVDTVDEADRVTLNSNTYSLNNYESHEDQNNTGRTDDFFSDDSFDNAVSSDDEGSPEDSTNRISENTATDSFVETKDIVLSHNNADNERRQSVRDWIVSSSAEIERSHDSGVSSSPGPIVSRMALTLATSGYTINNHQSVGSSNKSFQLRTNNNTNDGSDTNELTSDLSDSEQSVARKNDTISNESLQLTMNNTSEGTTQDSGGSDMNVSMSEVSDREQSVARSNKEVQSSANSDSDNSDGCSSFSNCDYGDYNNDTKDTALNTSHNQSDQNDLLLCDDSSNSSCENNHLADTSCDNSDTCGINSDTNNSKEKNRSKDSYLGERSKEDLSECDTSMHESYVNNDGSMSKLKNINYSNCFNQTESYLAEGTCTDRNEDGISIEVEDENLSLSENDNTDQNDHCPDSKRSVIFNHSVEGECCSKSDKEDFLLKISADDNVTATNNELLSSNDSTIHSVQSKDERNDISNSSDSETESKNGSSLSTDSNKEVSLVISGSDNDIYSDITSVKSSFSDLMESESDNNTNKDCNKSNSNDSISNSSNDSITNVDFHFSSIIVSDSEGTDMESSEKNNDGIQLNKKSNQKIASKGTHSSPHNSNDVVKKHSNCTILNMYQSNNADPATTNHITSFRRIRSKMLRRANSESESDGTTPMKKKPRLHKPNCQVKDNYITPNSTKCLPLEGNNSYNGIDNEKSWKNANHRKRRHEVDWQDNGKHKRQKSDCLTSASSKVTNSSNHQNVQFSINFNLNLGPNINTIHRPLEVPLMSSTPSATDTNAVPSNVCGTSVSNTNDEQRTTANMLRNTDLTPQFVSTRRNRNKHFNNIDKHISVPSETVTSDNNNTAALVNISHQNDTNNSHTVHLISSSDEESDPDWEPNVQSPSDCSISDDGDGCNSSIEDSPYTVYIPKSAAQMLDEWNSDESDESWEPS